MIWWKKSGYLLTSDVVDAGISKTYMAQFVKENKLERVAHGVYLSRDAVRDEYYILYLKNQKIIPELFTAAQVNT